MRKIIILLLLLIPLSAFGQQGRVQQSGSVSPGHGVKWIANGVVGDSGGLSALGNPVKVPNGGTGLTTLPAGSILIGNGTATPTFIAPSVNGDCLKVVNLAWALGPCGTSPPVVTGALLIGGDTTSCLLIGGDSTSCLLVN